MVHEAGPHRSVRLRAVLRVYAHIIRAAETAAAGVFTRVTAEAAQEHAELDRSRGY